MSSPQLRVSPNQTNQILAGLNRTDRQNVVPVYPVSVSHTLKFLSVGDRAKVSRRGERNRRHFRGVDAISIDHVAARVFGERQYLRGAAGGMTHRQTQLCSAAEVEGLRQMFEREVMNTHDYRAWTERGSGELHVQRSEEHTSELQSRLHLV